MPVSINSRLGRYEILSRIGAGGMGEVYRARDTNNAKLSPDGKWIAYDSYQTGRLEIFVQAFPNPGGRWQVSTNGGSRPVWSRDGKELYYIALDGNLMAAGRESPARWQLRRRRCKGAVRSQHWTRRPE